MKIVWLASVPDCELRKLIIELMWIREMNRGSGTHYPYSFAGKRKVLGLYSNGEGENNDS